MDRREILNDIKSNIISWYDFKEDATLLAIGDDLEQITQYLCTKLSKVVLTKQNEMPKVEPDEKFDYFLIKDDIKCLETTKRFLKPDGTILLILNNRFGITNFAKSNGFQSICEESSKVFGKDEIEEILNNQGFLNYKFFYPLPNYENANVIFSDDYLPDYNHTKLLNNIIYDENSVILFNELQALKQLTKAGKFKDFANSYFVEINPKSVVKFASFNNARKKEYRLCTKIYNDCVIKEPTNDEAKNHISNMAQNIQALQTRGFEVIDREEDGKIISKFVSDKTLYQVVVEAINSDKIEEAYQLIENWFEDITLKFLNDKSDELNNEIFANGKNCERLTIVRNAYIDFVFENTFVENNKFVFFDQEWSLKNVPLEFILYRAINNMYTYNSEIENKLPKNSVLQRFGLLEYLEIFEASEKKLQSQIIDEEIVKLYNENHITLKILLEEHKKKEEYIEILTKEKDDLEAKARLLEIEENKKAEYIEDLIKQKGNLEARNKLLEAEEKKKAEYIEELTQENNNIKNSIMELENIKKNQNETINELQGVVKKNEEIIEHLKEIIKVKEYQIETFENMRIIKLLKKLRRKKLN